MGLITETSKDGNILTTAGTGKVKFKESEPERIMGLRQLVTCKESVVNIIVIA